MKLEINPEVFGALAFYSAILISKVLLMSILTAKNRVSKKVFANPEDLAHLDPKKVKVKHDDPDVERVRRAHLNDLENILPFIITAFFYGFTDPDVSTARLLFRVFTGARILHTFVYAIYPVRQPARLLACAIGYLVNFYMIFEIIMRFAAAEQIGLDVLNSVF